MFQPPLTVINQDPGKMGQQAISLLFDLIYNKVKGKPDDINLMVEFLWKKSNRGKEKRIEKLWNFKSEII